MLFNSLTFALFLAVVLALHACIRAHEERKRLLLASSYIFYAAWSPPYVLILWLSTTLDWGLARWLRRCQNARHRKQILIASIVANLSLLAYFKYGGFLLDNYHHITTALGFAHAPPAWDIVLPVGISFYTFASLSYTIDVYRREIQAEISLLDYALFVGFFPHLVAGPIVRASQFLPQLQTPRSITLEALGWGFVLLIVGLAGKMILADSLFAPIVDEVYSEPTQYTAMNAWLACFAFSGQIYFDFAGYSTCAIGIALLFGYSFPDNFRSPYAAAGFTDFWKRWHISLSSWLRDYLYVPLGGNRNGRWKIYRNLLLTMLIGGLWHGASWMFLLWGAIHGCLLVIERAFFQAEPLKPSITAIAITFILASLAWIPFRATDIRELTGLLGTMLGSDGTRSIDPLLLSLGTLGITLMLVWQIVYRDCSLEHVAMRLSLSMRILVLTSLLMGIFLCSGGEERAFIYFQF